MGIVLVRPVALRWNYLRCFRRFWVIGVLRRRRCRVRRRCRCLGVTVVLCRRRGRSRSRCWCFWNQQNELLGRREHYCSLIATNFTLVFRVLICLLARREINDIKHDFVILVPRDSKPDAFESLIICLLNLGGDVRSIPSPSVIVFVLPSHFCRRSF